MIETVGRYEILEKLGEGGFAIVYKGRDTTLDRMVALKELRPLLLQDKAWAKRFQREARTIARLDHPNIVPIYDVHQWDERLFIVMRLIEGVSLEEQIRRQRHLSWSETLHAMIHLSAGLAYAHDQGVLHRDLKPANILVDVDRGPMLSDFGLAKLVGEFSMSVSESGSIVGTPHYIAPEVWEGQPPSAQSDIYAMGCILYEMINGEKIFRGDTPPAVMLAHFKPLSLPNVWPEGFPPGVAGIIRTALAQHPAERYASVFEMAQALTDLTPDSSIPFSLLAEQMVNRTSKTKSIPMPLAPRDQPDTTDSSSPVPAVAVEVTPLVGQLDTPVPPGSPVPPPPESVSVPIAKKHSPAGFIKRGCLIKGVVISLVIILLLVVGLGSFCAAFGGQLGQNINAPLESLINLTVNKIQVTDPVTETIAIPVPEEVKNPRLEIEVMANRFELTSGGPHLLAEGTANYNVALLKPKVSLNGSTIRLGHEGTTSDVLLLMVNNFLRNDIRDDWSLRLGSMPMSLRLSTGTAMTNVQLKEYALNDFSITPGAATEYDLVFLAPNTVEMETFEFSSTLVKRVNVSGLAYARPRNIRFGVDSGEFLLDFSGELQNDINVELGGNQGTFTLIIPEGIPVELKAKQPNNISLDVPTTWEQQSSGQFSYPGQGHTIYIDVGLDSGGVKLRNQ
jgi:serine/threonine protein kinase